MSAPRLHAWRRTADRCRLPAGRPANRRCGKFRHAGGSAQYDPGGDRGATLPQSSQQPRSCLTATFDDRRGGRHTGGRFCSTATETGCGSCQSTSRSHRVSNGTITTRRSAGTFVIALPKRRSERITRNAEASNNPAYWPVGCPGIILMLPTSFSKVRFAGRQQPGSPLTTLPNICLQPLAPTQPRLVRFWQPSSCAAGIHCCWRPSSCWPGAGHLRGGGAKRSEKLRSPGLFQAMPRARGFRSITSVRSGASAAAGDLLTVMRAAWRSTC